MNMTMAMGHDHPTNGTESIHSDGMEMPAIFTTGTHITLFFKDWTTASYSSYVLTLFFLFLLAWFNRFLGILKLQLESRAHSVHHIPSAPVLASAAARRRRNIKEHMSPLPLYMEIDKNDDENSSQFPSTPFLRSQGQREHGRRLDSNGADQSQSFITRSFRRLCSAWTLTRLWSWRHDGLYSFIEGVRASIGYLLMLAVMTFNIGVFSAVISGIIVSELVLGRYAGHSPGWQDGACHDG
ncbi:hypothetical protein DTO021C3_2892 [Paecilomyces variotii]|nr:hypothetical protein DTO021C3_2892 [Paecilomyces variotii]KAJ9322832.1 hypothetical protein DTO027B3_6213 [Paecilomyces variotii]